MSSFLSQRIVNNYPAWAKLRRDPSSAGRRFFDALSVQEDAHLTNLVKYLNEYNVLKSGLGNAHLWYLDLEEADMLDKVMSPGGIITYDGTLTVTGDSSWNIEEQPNLEEFLHAPPTRLDSEEAHHVIEQVLWDSENPSVLHPVICPEFLYVVVSGSTNYTRRTQDQSFNDVSVITLNAKDINGNRIQEEIQVADDGVYQTRHIVGELTEAPRWAGFDGRIRICYKGAHTTPQRDVFRVAVTEETEGPLLLSLEQDGSVKYSTVRFTEGKRYRQDQQALVNELLLGTQSLLDMNGAATTPTDIAVGPDDARLYAVEGSRLRVYEHGLTPFSPPSEDVTTFSSMEIHPLQHYERHGATSRLWVNHARVRDFISHVRIQRISPSGVVRWLQADNSWGVSPYNIPGNTRAKTPIESWQDFSFQTEYNEYGQWDYYILTTPANEPAESYHTAVMVDSLMPVAEMMISAGQYEYVFFSHDGRIGFIGGDWISYLEMQYDWYCIDKQTQRLFFRTQYPDIQVVRT